MPSSPQSSYGLSGFLLKWTASKAPASGDLATPVPGEQNDVAVDGLQGGHHPSKGLCLLRCKLEFLKGPCAQQFPAGTPRAT